MKIKILTIIFIFCATILFAQTIAPKKCNTCGKPLSHCQYKGKHTKTNLGYENEHEWVDLGLSVKWATCNIGASSPEEYGDYYAWGVSLPGEVYTYDNHPLKDIEKNYTLLSIYDTATNLWVANWRMPTVSEFEELVKKCKWERETINGINGYRVTGPNGESIFFPAAGSNAPIYNQKQVDGSYWSSSIKKPGVSEHSGDICHNKYLHFRKEKRPEVSGCPPQVAMSIRPVLNKNK